MQVEVDKVCMCTKFVDVASPFSKILLLFISFKFAKINISFGPWGKIVKST